jgi:hypothetical protein
LTVDVDVLVNAELKKLNATIETVALWENLLRAYDAGGPRGVKELLQDQVGEARKRAGKEAREVGKVVAVAARPKRKGRK